MIEMINEHIKRIRKTFRNEQNRLFLYVLLCFLVLKSFVYLNGIVFFDEGVYTGIAKYFISFGQYGYFETLRPLLLPFILAPLQLIPVNSLIMGRLVGICLGVLSLFIVYYSCKKHFGKRAAIWSALLFAGSHSILFFGGYILVDVISGALTMFSASLVLRKRYPESGVVIGFAFLFKFPAVIILPLLLAAIIILEKKESIKPVIKFLASSFIVVLPFFVNNLLRYEGTLIERLTKPMMEARVIIESPTWIYQTSSIFEYIRHLMIAEFFIVVFAVISAYFLYKENRNLLVLFLACVASFIFYFGMIVPRYDVRYIITFLPFLIMLAGYGMMKSEKVLKGRIRVETKYILIILALISGILTASSSFFMVPVQSDISIENIISEHSGEHIITDSAFPILYAKNKITLYPGPSLSNTFTAYQEDENSDMFVLDPDGYPCPVGNEFCINETNKRISRIMTENGLINCGKLNGARVLLVSKNESRISAEECGEKLGYKIYDDLKGTVFFRLNGVVFTEEGDIANADNVKNMIDSIVQNNIKVIVNFVPVKNILNQETIEYINGLSSSLDFSVNHDDIKETNEFIELFETNTQKEISIVNPKNDHWIGKIIEIPEGISGHMIGSWDLSNVNLERKIIDVYTTKNWNEKELYSEDEIIKKIEHLLKSDYEIGVDISADILTENNVKILNILVNSL